MTRESAGGTAEGTLAETCSEILELLRQRPEARDTLEGIVEWWLLERDLRREIEKVRRAVEHLVREGRIEARTGPDGRISYGLPRATASHAGTESGGAGPGRAPEDGSGGEGEDRP
ncbi:MAG: hypothetical protein MI919_20840 [Holophagales bacterium]|nr:hypothetical protein [Holophagales bacterium]